MHCPPYDHVPARALTQALQVQKGETFEWVIEDGELVLKRMGMLPKRRR